MKNTKKKNGAAAKGKGRATLSAQQTIPYLSMHPDGVCLSLIHIFLQRKELMDDPAQRAPASGKEEFYLSKKDDVLLTPEQIAAEERRCLLYTS